MTSLWQAGAGQLSVLSDANDSISIATDAAGNVEVLVNGVIDTSVPPIDAGDVASIVVEGGDQPNRIDLRYVTAADFDYVDPVSGDPMKVRIVGHNGDDTVYGSAGFGDTILGGHGDDLLDGRGGDDSIDAGDGDDTVYGQDGNDTILGGDGKDLVFGLNGGDEIYGGDGNDTLNGGEGPDLIYGGDHSDLISGNNDRDTLNGESGADTIRGGAGADSIRGGGAADLLEGGDGDDILNGQGADDTLDGGNGDDSLIGGAGVDSLYGNNGNDRLSGSGGGDILVGAFGDDSLYGGAGHDTLYGDSADPSQTGDGNDVLKGQGGHDTLYGGGGADRLEGGDGNDLIDSFLPQLTLIMVDDPVVSAEGDTASLSVFSTDFEGSLSSQFSGFTSTVSVQGFAGLGTTSNIFSGNFLHNDTGCCAAVPTTPQTATRLTLTNLPDHESVDIDFLLAVINSWNNAADSSVYGPDNFVVTVDGSTIFNANFRNLDGTGAGYSPPPGVALTLPPLSDLGFPGPSGPLGRNDSAFDLGLDPTFDAIIHTSSTLTIEWLAEGGWEGGANESWAIDNVEVILNGVPVQSTATFVVSLTHASKKAISVGYATADATATAGSDYIASAGTLVFSPGTTKQTIGVTVLGDTAVEGDETFSLNLSAPVNAAIGDVQGIATITDDDGAAPVTYWPEQWSPETEARQWVVELAPWVDEAMLGTMLGIDPKPTGLIEDTYTLTLPEGQDPAELIAMLESLDGVAHFYPLDTHVMATRAVPDDPLYPDQWHLNNTAQTGGTAGADANVESVWDTYRGSGVVIGIVDDGLQHSHPDLNANYDPNLSYDFNGNDSDPTPASGDGHGTSVAGVTAGVGFNGLGISGAAPAATLAGLRLLGGPVTDQLEANALTYEIQQIDIYNNSWGPPDAFSWMTAPGPLTVSALSSGVTTGRGGLGVIYTWSGGNGGDSSDNVNYDGYANSRYTIAVGAIDHNGVRSSYSEPGAPLIVTAYSSGNAGAGITTTDLVGSDGYSSNDYADDFGGTSSAAPLVSGVIGLMLEANPNLTYRDVNHVLVNSARVTDQNDADWDRNAAGHDINHNYGFGAIDAAAAVLAASTWTNVSPEIAASTGVTAVATPIPDNDNTGVSSTVTITGDIVVEYVEIVLNATHTQRGDLAIELTSPGGTVSVLAETRSNDPGADYTNWMFTSARHWDERSLGDWTLNVRDLASSATGTFDDWTLNVYGTAPQGGPPAEPPPTPQDPDTIGDTLIGNAGNDTLRGALGDDRLNGGGGNDLIEASGGDDVLHGGGARDTLLGGTGDDTLNGQGGIDVVDGNDDDDTLIWRVGDSSDSFFGTQGFDELIVKGTSANNKLTISESVAANLQIFDNTYTITVAASVTRVTINAGPGNDRVTIEDIRGAAGVLLVVNGETGSDTIDASGADLGDVRLLVQGGDGNDTITGSDNDDLLRGENGNDVIDGGAGVDTIDGGANHDVLIGGSGDDSLLGGLDNDTIFGGTGDDVLYGQVGHDVLTGDAGDDSLWGADGNDLLNGSAGDDQLEGGAGRDSLYGGNGHDYLDGGVDDDVLRGQNGNDTLAGRHGEDRLEGAAGADLINGGDGNDTIDGGTGDDTLGGHDGNDRLNGGGGADSLVGGDGADTLLGGSGADIAVGGDGNDFINGNGSTDVVAGGEGNDNLASNLASEIDEAFQMPASILSLLDAIS